MMPQMTVLITFVLCNAFFAATEIAFISLNDAKVERKAKEGDKKAKQIHKMLKNPSKFLATIQIGVTLAGLLSSAFAADAFAVRLADVLVAGTPIMSLSAAKTVSIILITMILAYFTLVFGELVPKRIAMKYHEEIAGFAIGIVRVFSIIALPFVKLLTFSTNLISKLFGVKEQDEEIVTEEEIKMMIDVGEEKGSIEEEEKELIHNVFEFNDKTASEIMTYRKDVFGIEMNSDIDAFLDEIDDYKYSRIPIYCETIDEIEGILNVKDIIKYLKRNEEVDIKALMREPYFVSENKMINELFRDLQKTKNQIAIVVDEYGGTAGIVTMEDIVEELVGNIFDEYDEVEHEYEKIDENTFRLHGGISISEAKKILGVEIEEGDYDTLSGYLTEQLGRIPEDEEKPIIETKQVTYKVEEYEDRRIIWVKACKNHTQEELEEEGEEE